ncbi:MAG TPA: thrombospondin type 3 repeat-containing protein [Polyangiaceae bacterium]
MALSLAGRASAEPIPSVDLRNFRPPTHPESLLTIEPTATPGPGEWNLGAWTSYAYRPVVVTDAFRKEDVPLVEHQLSLDLVGSIGVAERIGIGVSLPAILAQNGEEPPPSVGMSEPPPKSALGDLTLEGRATLLPQGAFGGFGLAAQARVELPTGNPESFASEAATRTSVGLLGELGFLGVSLRAAAAARARTAEQEFAGGTYGHDIPWGLGLVIKPQLLGIDAEEGRYAFGIDAHGAIAITPRFASKEESPAALALAAKRAFGDASLTLGAELPLAGAQGVPSVRAFAALGWAPRKHDEDGDDIDDDDDRCISLAEDRDGFEDSDGCPDFDNDGDGVADPEDRCPAELEDRDEFTDEDGCADLDDDRDGVPDRVDACPRESGPASPDAKLHGCRPRDRDRDGIVDSLDACPARHEDRDGFEDEDGCPDPDDDRDGVRDRDDACPRNAGILRSNPKLSGCPSPDRDGDTFDDALDTCPAAGETFDGVTDSDGCPEATPKRPLARFEAPPPKGARQLLRTTGVLAFEKHAGGVRLTTASDPTLRAIAALLNANPDHVVMVAVRPAGASPAAEQEALTKSFAVADALRTLTYRDDVAETIGWAALGRVPGATRPEGIGFLVLAPLPAPAPAPRQGEGDVR